MLKYKTGCDFYSIRKLSLGSNTKKLFNIFLSLYLPGKKKALMEETDKKSNLLFQLVGCLLYSLDLVERDFN